MSDGRSAHTAHDVPATSPSIVVGALVLAFHALLGCNENPSGQVTSARPAPSAKPPQAVKAPPKSYVTTQWVWRPDLCPPPPEPAGGRGSVVGKGACSFEQRGDADCELADDDFIVQTSRPSAHDATLSIYVNIDYHGPGKYEKTTLLVSVQDAKGLFRWRSDELVVTVGKGEKFVKLAPVRLEALPPVHASAIDVSGTLWCRPPAHERSPVTRP